MALIGESDLEVQQQLADRERVKALVKHCDGCPSPNDSAIPQLETIKEATDDPSGLLYHEVQDEFAGEVGTPARRQSVDEDSANSTPSSETPECEFIIDLSMNAFEQEDLVYPHNSDDNPLVLHHNNVDLLNHADNLPALQHDDQHPPDPTDDVLQDPGPVDDLLAPLLPDGGALPPHPDDLNLGAAEVGEGGQWRLREDRENTELQEIVEQRRILGEDLIAQIPRFPSPWRYVPVPDILPPTDPSRSVNDSLNYHPLVDRPFAGPFSQHAGHCHLWEHLPPTRTVMLKTPKNTPWSRIHHNHLRTRHGMGST